MSRVKISDLAEEDLSEIWFFIAQDNIEAADLFVDTILEKYNLLVSSPKMGAARPELAPNVRSFPVSSPDAPKCHPNRAVHTDVPQPRPHCGLHKLYRPAGGLAVNPVR